MGHHIWVLKGSVRWLPRYCPGEAAWAQAIRCGLLLDQQISAPALSQSPCLHVIAPHFQFLVNLLIRKGSSQETVEGIFPVAQGKMKAVGLPQAIPMELAVIRDPQSHPHLACEWSGHTHLCHQAQSESKAPGGRVLRDKSWCPRSGASAG